MKGMNFVAAAALLAISVPPLSAANRSVSEMTLPVSPDYRTMEADAARGAQFVWVHRIEGRDEAGNSRVLFNDMQGALLPLGQLGQADRLINPREAGNRGKYHELQLTLAGKMLSVSDKGMQHLPLPQGLGRHMVLRRKIEI